MTDHRVKILLHGATNLVVVCFVGSAWLVGKVTAAEALIPLLALSGLQVAGITKRGESLPPAGPTALALFLALQAAAPVAHAQPQYVAAVSHECTLS